MKRVLISLLTLLLLLILLSPAAFARAGGGGGSGGGGGGSGGSGSSHHSSGFGMNRGPRRFYGPYRSSSPAGTVAGAGTFVLAFAVIATAKSFQNSAPDTPKKETKKWLKAAAQNDSIWDSDAMKDQIQEAYLAIQQAWTDNRLEDARYYLSDSLYSTFQTKLSWMAQRNERNTLRHIRLLSATPVSACYDPPTEEPHNARLCCHIHGKMVDYISDRTTGRFISGSYLPRSFVEYWCFIRNADNTRWILDRIYQKDEYEGR